MHAGTQNGANPPLLERERELEALDAALTAAVAGEGRALAAVGEAGIGKSSLLALVREHARDRGLRVLSATGSELERDFPFGICRQLLEPVLAGAGNAERRSLMEGAAAIGGRLVLAAPEPDGASGRAPRTGAGAGGAGRELPDAAFAQFHGLYWLLANLADRGPVAVAIDDAHWADVPSLRLLAYLGRRIHELAIVAVIAAREPEPDAGGGALQALLAAPEVEVLQLESLGEEASAELIREALGPRPAAEFVAACRQATGGNPFYLAELLRELRAARIAPSSGTARQVAEVGPRAISRAVLGRIAHLAPECAALVRALAVLGGRAHARDVAVLAGLDEDASARACDALARASVLARGLPPTFSHPIVRAAVYEAIPPHERADAHRRAAALLADRGAAVAEVAAHVLRTPPAKDTWARAQLAAAARASLAEGAAQSATEYLRRALAESPPASERYELSRLLGTVLVHEGELEDGIELLRAVAESAPDSELRGRSAIPLASTLVYTNRPVEGVEVLDHAIAGLGEEPVSRELAAHLEALLLVMGITALSARRSLRARLTEMAARAAEDPESLPAPLLAPLAIEAAFAGRPAAEVGRLAERALRGGALLHDAPPYSPLPYVAAYALISAGRTREAERWLDDAIERATRHGVPGRFTVASAARGLARLWQGDLRGAEVDAETSMRLGAGSRREVFFPIALSVLGTVRLERGELEDARELLDSPQAQAADASGVLTLPLLEARARLRCAEGNDDGGRRELERCRSWAADWDERGGSWPVQWRSALALAELRAGSRARALELAREDVDLARRFGASRPLGRSLVALGLCEGGERGIALLREAVAELTRSEDRLEHARALVELGGALRRGGERRAARNPLGEGMHIARSCGATALAERAYEELRVVGARPQRILYSGVEALTASELRVARMAADGLTNRQIAQSLFVTQKTVEVHLSHTYQKLDIASRAELPAALADDPSS